MIHELKQTGEELQRLLDLLAVLQGQIGNGDKLLTSEQNSTLSDRVEDGHINTFPELIDFLKGIGEAETLKELLEKNATAQLPEEDRELLKELKDLIEKGGIKGLIDDVETLKNKVEKMPEVEEISADELSALLKE